MDLEKKKKKPVVFFIMLALIGIFFFLVLELNKNMIAGWVITAGLLIGFAIWRNRSLRYKKRWKSFLAWLGFFASLFFVIWATQGPYKLRPAVEGGNGGKTGVISTVQGDLTGVYTRDKKVEVYAGIPYAKPPIGDLRWKEPQDPDKWSGVLTADHFGPMSMQPSKGNIIDSLTRIIGYHDYNISLEDNFRDVMSEDSLYLNVWKPAGDISKAPVLVYIHGGGLETGQSWYEDYNGESLAREGVVVVNMAYRLGVFGYYADEELRSESANNTTGNYGMLDQIKALEWVKKNISTFGGDPDNITISGESAGSAAVSALCTSPLAKGLFNRAIGESSSVTAAQPAHSFRSFEDAIKDGKETREKLAGSGENTASINDLRKIPAQDLVEMTKLNHYMTVDGYALTETPYESYKKGVHNEEALLEGYNARESEAFTIMHEADLKNYHDRLSDMFGEYTDEILKLYPASTNEEAKKNFRELFTVYYFSYGHYIWSKQGAANNEKVYEYYFTKENGRLGSWHSGEEVYFYKNIPENSKLYNESDYKLKEIMSSYFKNFIFTGDPNGDGLSVLKESVDGTDLMEFGDKVGMTKDKYIKVYEILEKLNR